MDDEVGAAPSRAGEPGKVEAEEHALGSGEPLGLGTEEDGAQFVLHFVK
jgi:hypothetical protein